MGGGDEDESLAVGGVIFIIFGEAPIVGKPTEGSLHNPTFGQDLETMKVRAFDHFQAQAATWQQCLEPLAEGWAGIAAIHPDQAQPTKGQLQFLELQPGAVAILNVGRMHHHRENQTQRVHQEMSFSSQDLLACIVAAHSSVVRYFNALAVEDRSGRGFFFPLLSRTASRSES